MSSMVAEQELVDFASRRVEAAKEEMRDAQRAPQARGRLFFAQRIHDAAAKGYTDPDRTLKDLLPLLDKAGKEGARAEHQVFRERA